MLYVMAEDTEQGKGVNDMATTPDGRECPRCRTAEDDCPQWCKDLD